MNPVSYIYVVGRMCMTLSIFDLVQSVRVLHIEYTAFCTPFQLAPNKCRTETFAKRNTKKRPQSYLPVLRYEECEGGGSNIEFVRPFCAPAYNRNRYNGEWEGNGYTTVHNDMPLCRVIVLVHATPATIPLLFSILLLSKWTRFWWWWAY